MRRTVTTTSSRRASHIDVTYVSLTYALGVLILLNRQTVSICVHFSVYEQNKPVRLEARPLPEVNLYDELTLARSRPASRTRQPGNGYLVPPAAAAAAPDSNAARPSSGYSTPIPSNARPNSGYSTQIPSDTRPDSGYSAPDSSDSTPNDSGYFLITVCMATLHRKLNK